MVDKSVRRWIERLPITHSTSSNAKLTKTNHSFVFIPYTQTHTPHDPHPDARGKTGNGDFADILAQTDTYIGELQTGIFWPIVSLAAQYTRACSFQPP